MGARASAHITNQIAKSETTPAKRPGIQFVRMTRRVSRRLSDCAGFISFDCVLARDDVDGNGFLTGGDVDRVNRVAAFIDPAYALTCGRRPEGTCNPTAGVPCEPRPQDKDQQRCINALNKNLQKVASRQGKEICECIKDGARGKLTEPNNPIENCLTADLGAVVALPNPALIG